MAIAEILICQKVKLRKEFVIDVKSAYSNIDFSFDLSAAAVEFVKNAGENAVAFVSEKMGCKLLLICNTKTGDLFVPETYSEERQKEIKSMFLSFLFDSVHIDYGIVRKKV